MDHNLVVIEKALWDILIAKIDNLTEQVQQLVKHRTEPDIMTHKEAAQYIGYSAIGLHKLKNEKSITFSQHRRKIIYRRDDLDTFIEEHRIRKRK